MNKILKTMMLAAVTAFGLASCEDVPAPFIEPEMPGAGGGEDITLPYTSANLKDGFEVYTPTGNAWSLGNTYAKATGYNSGSTTASETYLISPAIPLGDAEQVYVDFKYVIAYTNSLGLEEGHQVLVCFEYNTEDPAASNWAKLPFEPKEREDRNSWDMYSANTMSIPADMLGKEIRIAFLYKCNSNSASTWELTNLSISTEPGGEVTPDTPDTPDTPTDGGTWDKPYTVAQAIANQTGKEVWVHGYIVGSIPADVSPFVLENMTFTADGASGTNICIADVPDETNYANCAPVQLPGGSDARTDLNLMNNPSKLGVEVWLKGKATTYFGAPGLKEISKYTLTAPTAEDDQAPSEEPTEDPKGDGSLENPYNVSAVLSLYAKGNPEGQSVYVKGKISKIKSLDVSQWERAQYFISDDGTENAQFQIYNGYYLDGKPFTSNDQIKVGDEVIVYGELSSYQGTPQIAQNSKIVSINGQTGDGDTPGDEGEGDQDDNEEEIPTEGNILENGDFELWEGNIPTNWKSASTAGNVSITQSTEAHGGTFAANMGFVASTNKRMAYKETTLPAGTYKFTFYAKGTDTTTGSKCQTRPGYVPMKADGSADSQNYKYGEYATLSATEWTLVEHEFTLEAETTLCLVIMSPKNSNYHTSQNILVDDASLIKIK